VSNNDIFDFGFTFVDEDEIEAVQEAQTAASQTSSTVQELEDKINNLYNAITPLLSNLKMNPEKEYLKWPNRVQAVEAFEDKIAKIIK